MPRAKSSGSMPMEANRNLALKVLGIDKEALLGLTTPTLKKARVAACLRNHPDKLGPEGESEFTIDQIEWACGILQRSAEEGDQRVELENAKLAQIQCCFGQYFCESTCEHCLALAIRSFSCPGCCRRQAHAEQCGLKKVFSNCRSPAEQRRFFQISAHESFMVASADLSRCHGHADGLRKAEEEIRRKHEHEKRKLEAQSARFAKRQPLMTSFENALQFSPHKPQRSAPDLASAANGPPVRPPAQSYLGVLEAKVSKGNKRYRSTDCPEVPKENGYKAT